MSNQNLPTLEPNEAKKLQAVLRAVIADMDIVQQRREAINETLAEAAKEFNIKGKWLRKLAKTRLKSNYADVAEENDTFSVLYEAVFPVSIPASVSDPLDKDEE